MASRSTVSAPNIITLYLGEVHKSGGLLTAEQEKAPGRKMAQALERAFDSLCNDKTAQAFGLTLSRELKPTIGDRIRCLISDSSSPQQGMRSLIAAIVEMDSKASPNRPHRTRSDLLEVFIKHSETTAKELSAALSRFWKPLVLL